jgi:hypothetical protein
MHWHAGPHRVSAHPWARMHAHAHAAHNLNACAREHVCAACQCTRTGTRTASDPRTHAARGSVGTRAHTLRTRAHTQRTCTHTHSRRHTHTHAHVFHFAKPIPQQDGPARLCPRANSHRAHDFISCFTTVRKQNETVGVAFTPEISILHPKFLCISSQNIMLSPLTRASRSAHDQP